MPGGNSERTDSFRMCLRRPLAILKCAGSVAAKSMTRLSRSGTRDSIECAMLMRSTLVSTSSGRYVSKSKRIIRLWCGSAANLPNREPTLFSALHEPSERRTSGEYKAIFSSS